MPDLNVRTGVFPEPALRWALAVWIPVLWGVLATPALGQVRAPEPYPHFVFEKPSRPDAPPSLHPRISQAAWGAGTYLGGFVAGILVFGPARGECLFAESPAPRRCTDVMVVGTVAAGLLAAAAIEGARSGDRAGGAGYPGVLIGAAAGFGIAHLVGATRDGGAVVRVALPLQVGGALLGDWWSERQTR